MEESKSRYEVVISDNQIFLKDNLTGKWRVLQLEENQEDGVYFLKFDDSDEPIEVVVVNLDDDVEIDDIDEEDSEGLS